MFDCWRRRVFGNGLCLIVSLFSLVVVFLFVVFVFVVNTEIESERLNFNLMENESDGLEFGIPKLSLSHLRC